MEWITHTTTGFFVGQALLKPEERPKRAGWWWTIASISPDWLEVATRYFGDIHRGVTHSLYAWPVLAIIWALAAKRWGGQQTASVQKLWLVFMAVLGSHLFLDVLMSYRWYLAWPFSQERWAFDIMPFYDIYIFGGWVLLLIVHHWRKLPSMRTAKIGLVIFLLMFAVRSAGKLRAGVVAERLMSAAEVRTLPVYYQPWLWYASASGERRDRTTPVNIFTEQLVSPSEIIRPYFPRMPQFIRDLRRHRRG